MYSVFCLCLCLSHYLFTITHGRLLRDRVTKYCATNSAAMFKTRVELTTTTSIDIVYHASEQMILETLDIFQLIPRRVRYSLVEAVCSKRIRESKTIFSALVDCADRLGDVLHRATITSPQAVIRPNLEDDGP